jgi:hypothetical protein
MGRLARDPETQTTTTGKLKCRMTIAVDRPKARDGTQSLESICPGTANLEYHLRTRGLKHD